MRLRALNALWGLRRRVYVVTPAWHLLVRLQCAGNRAIPIYVPRFPHYHGGDIVRQCCVRLAWHRGLCLAPIDEHGEPVPHGTWFTSAQPRG